LTPNPFKHGDVVRLKSNRRLMQVEETSMSIELDRHSIWCVWLEGGKERRDVFDPDELELVPPV
jgi:uncharacterized protein YodC (DUF2158 family)